MNDKTKSLIETLAICTTVAAITISCVFRICEYAENTTFEKAEIEKAKNMEAYWKGKAYGMEGTK